MQAQVINNVFAGIGKKLSTKFGDLVIPKESIQNDDDSL